MVLTPLASHAAGGATSVRAIGFTASNDRGATDPRLAPYEAVLRRNLRFESFKYVGESSASVARGGSASLSLPGGGSVKLESDNAGNVRVQRDGNVVTVSPGRPAVFMGGPAGNGGVSGVIIMAN
ncbi:hypothetical protein DB354_10745 [Opitutus sp. ER46]|nr:hypothetical protein DB354_10745 [Opitutus sp. ER46]